MTNYTQDFTEQEKAAMNAYRASYIEKLHELDIVQALDLQKSKVSGYNCPICNSGRGPNGTGIQVTSDRKRATCYSGQHFGKTPQGSIAPGDIIDWLKQIYVCSTDEAIKQIYPEYDMAIPLKECKNTGNAPQGHKSTQEQAYANKGEIYQTKLQTDYTAYFRECMGRITDKAVSDYLAYRGLSTETALKYCIGYDASWQSPKALSEGKNPPKSPRLIIPTSKYSYTARDIRKDIPEEANKYKKMKEGSVNIFNIKELDNNSKEPIFIVEGEIDALSIIEIGKRAIGLGSTSNKDKLINKLKEKPMLNTFILCLDKDEPGQKAEKELAKDLEKLNIPFLQADISGEYKDANEALTRNRAEFEKRANIATRKAVQPDNISDYLKQFFKKDIKEFQKSISTGFSTLDIRAGGLYPGLYVIGAISSLGKTTFIHQMADQMATAGEHILFFSLEQSRFEMASKSLARLAAKKDIKNAPSSLEIRKGHITPLVQEVYIEYAEKVDTRLSIIEGNFNCNIGFISNYIENYIRANKVKPVVIIDYLQILDGAPDQKQTTRDAIDTNVRELKRISRNNDIPVIVISSLNRSNYLTPVDFESFKESGGIEYTADVVWGLQLSIMNDDIFNSPNKIKEKREAVRIAKAATPREVELVCLKNRYGISSYKVPFLYYPEHDLFNGNEEIPF